MNPEEGLFHSNSDPLYSKTVEKRSSGTGLNVGSFTHTADEEFFAVLLSKQ
jgi:hypothetical protein